jgi:Nucleotidyl transferase AbiEii toxin, Type IV TA system
MFSPKLNILPAPQRLLWSELSATPPEFILYGGTAIALRLGHRESVDFGFFSFGPFDPQALLDEIQFLSGAAVLQSAPSTLTCRIHRGGPVQVSYFGVPLLGQVAEPESPEGVPISVASLLDMGGMKAAVVTRRAELRDYLDIHALLAAGLSLAEMLAAAEAIYGPQFSPLVALKAVGYHDDPALKSLPVGMRRDLARAVKGVDLLSLPAIHPFRRRKK